jgi:ABC-2 type transport system ATP-binding protein
VEPEKVMVRKPEIKIDKSVKAISVTGLTKSYKNAKILDNVSFSLNQGRLCAVVGPSGGGKSTVIESIIGRLTPDAGEIKILGMDAEKYREKINKLVGFVPQHPELYMDQSVWRNMMNSALKWNVKDAEAKSERILKHLGIYERKDVSAKNLSGGQLKRLSLGMELIREPPILVLDEPTTGLDPTSRDQILSALSKMVFTDKRTVIFTTHFMDEAEHCDEVILVGDAKILAKGAPSELARRMPGMGKIVQVTLEEVSGNLVSKISKIRGVKKVIREGRVLKIIMDSPELVKISQKIEEFGGIIEGSKIAKARMKEVFVYYTGVHPEE